MKCWAASAPVMNHLWPSITQRSPFFTARVRMAAGSEPPPGMGSVMAKAERTRPSTIGMSQRCLCSAVPVLGKQDHIAVVGCGAVEGGGAEDRTAHRLVAGRHGRDIEAETAQLPRHLGRPEPGRLGLGAQGLQHRQGDILMLVVVRPVRFQRHDLGGDEIGDPPSQGFGLWRQREIHARLRR